jgi:O-succinylbenzoate synthase
VLSELLIQAADKTGDATYFRVGGEAGDGPREFTFRETRDEALELAQRLAGWGVRGGDVLAIDLPNCADFVFLLFAGSMLDISFFLLNHRLTDAKKAELLEGFRVRAVVDTGWLEAARGRERETFFPREPGLDAVFLRMFTSGTTGLPKAAGLSYGNLLAAAESSAAAFMQPKRGNWQLALPMYHVGGLMIALRALVNASSFTLYECFDAAGMLREAADGAATHVSVVDRMLAGMLTAGGGAEALARYEVVLLGGGAPNARTLDEALGARVYVSYGMTEGCATVAASPLADAADGGMVPLPGYEVAILGPDVDGVGEIALSGPAVFEGYIEPGPAASAARPARDTSAFADGRFHTGDRGRYQGGRLFVQERVADVFVSGGENVYPAEIEREILSLPGVTDACVLGVEDAAWGRRPVAFVAGEGVSAGDIATALEGRLARFQRPDAVFVLDELPTSAICKIDRPRLLEMWEQRIEVERVTLYRIRQPLKTPFRTSQGVLEERESIIVEVADAAGRSGFGECVAFSTPFYTSETVEGAMRVLEEQLAPIVCATTYLHPGDMFASLAGVADNLMAKGAIEPACWDLFGRITRRPLRELLGESAGVTPQPTAPAGVSLGIMPVAETITQLERYVAAGYTRVKLKIAPGDDVGRVSAVRERFGDLTLTVDANQGYTAADAGVFEQLAGLGVVFVEEPLADPTPEALNDFQARIPLTISVDESIETETDLAAVLAQPALRNINLKIGKFGGVLPSLNLYRLARERGIDLWLGGMYETGVSKYLHAQFETLGGFVVPGDISESQRYFERDIVIPEVVVDNGDIVIPDGPGLAFELDRKRIEELLVEKREVRRHGD